MERMQPGEADLTQNPLPRDQSRRDWGSDTSVMESGNKEGFENMTFERRERKERVTGHY